MANDPTMFVDDAAVTAGEARVATADFDSGMNAGASNAPGLGIATDNPDLQESLQPGTNGDALSTTGPWTLEDQHGDARAAQIGQLIGGDGITEAADWPGSGGVEGTLPDAVIRMATNPDNVDGAPVADGAPTPTGNATLAALEDGWTAV